MEWGNVQNVLIAMSGTKWPSSKHHLFFHSLKGLSTHMMFLSGCYHFVGQCDCRDSQSCLRVMLTGMGLLPVFLAIPLLVELKCCDTFFHLISLKLKSLWGCWPTLCRVTHLFCPRACWDHLLSSVCNTCPHPTQTSASETRLSPEGLC